MITMSVELMSMSQQLTDYARSAKL